jgi:hypothetical protein
MSLFFVQKLSKNCQTFRNTRCNGAMVQWCNNKQELNSLVTSCDKARRGGKIY